MASWSSIGDNCRQGPHQVAEKSTIAGRLPKNFQSFELKSAMRVENSFSPISRTAVFFTVVAVVVDVLAVCGFAHISMQPSAVNADAISIIVVFFIIIVALCDVWD